MTVCCRESTTHTELETLRRDYCHNITAADFTKLRLIKPHFMALPNAEKLRHILGENSKMITTAARYASN